MRHNAWTVFVALFAGLVIGAVGTIMTTNMIADSRRDSTVGVIYDVSTRPYEVRVSVNFTDGHRRMYSIPDTGDVIYMFRLGDTVLVRSEVSSIVQLRRPWKYYINTKPIY